MTIHAHVSTESADCDGRYSRGYVLIADEGQDDFDFREFVAGNILGLRDNGKSEFRENGFWFSGPTDEGFVTYDVEWCNEDDTDEPNTFHDHSAEAAGY